MREQSSRVQFLLSFARRPENWVNFIALMVTVILGYRSITSGSVNDYFQAVLAVLGILALSQLAVGYSSILRDREIARLSESVIALSTTRLSTELFFQTRERLLPVQTRLLNAKTTIDILGVSLASVAITNQGALRSAADSGVKIRLIVTNPENGYLQKLVATGCFEIDNADRHTSLVRTVIESVQACARRISDGSLDIRVTDYLPSYSYFGVDTNNRQGEIHIELYLCKVPVGRNPIFSLDPITDPRWYGEFRNQFEIFWNNAEPIELTPEPTDVSESV